MKVCLFGGTTEGRRAAELLQEESALLLTVCVATQYGEFPLQRLNRTTIHAGRLNAEEMESFFAAENFAVVVDATHPYAKEVTQNIKRAAKACNIKYLRVQRDEETGCSLDEAVCVDSAQKAAEYLEARDGRILLTTGVKELACFRRISRERLWVRVLPSCVSIEECMREGITPAHIIAMEGPFSEKMNRCQLEEINAEYLVTKNSGKAGGFSEKIEAAKKCGVTAVVIGRTDEQQGVCVEDAVNCVKEMCRKDLKTDALVKVKIIGVGMGTSQCLTIEANEAIWQAQVLIGAKRLLEEYPHKKKIIEIVPEKIRKLLKEASAGFGNNSSRESNYAVLVSGDVGFYSAAKGLLEALNSLENCEVSCIPGVGCISYFASRLNMSWEDCALVSLHGRWQNLLHSVRMNRRVLALTGGTNCAADICRTLLEYGYGEVRVTVGQNLSYPNEKIVSGSAEELADMVFDSLSVLLIENPQAICAYSAGIADEEFIRGEVPMTKQEVRAVTISYLQLDADSVVYDIGAGTGSVSVECALAAFRGRVYAIEKNPKAAELILQNKKKFAVENLILTSGTAPEILDGLEAPTHVFVGGSSGNLRNILEMVQRKNEEAVIVMNAVTLETLAQALDCAKEFGYDDSEYTQLGVARGTVAGKYHLMTAQNPVTIIRFRKKRG